MNFSACSAISAVRVLRRFTAEDTENAEKKMALINYMKFGFSEPAPDHDLGISAMTHFVGAGSAIAFQNMHYRGTSLIKWRYHD